jgi:prephenate dehydratase
MKSNETKVIFLGPKFTFSHEAALKLFPHARYFYELSPKEIFKKVDSKEMDYGILPVENSATGIVTEFYPLLLDQDYQVFGDNVRVHVMKELYLPIYQHLLARNHLPLGEIQTVYSNRQPYLQCVDWLQDNLPRVKVEFTDSTAASAEKLAQDSKGACIGGNLLTKHEKLVKVRENIQDYSKNVTRFFAISAKHTRIPMDANKTTFAVIIPDRIGTLVQALQLVSSAGISLMNIKTLPVRAAHVFTEDFKDWFIIDVATGSHAPGFHSLRTQFEDKKDMVLSYKFLGSYVSRLNRRGPLGFSQPTKKGPVQRGSVDRETFYAELIKGGEGESVEFKASLRFDFKTHSVNKDLAKAVAKTLCGFMNSSGGYLFIGVGDEGQPVGIDQDINLLTKKTADGFLSAFYQVVSDLIGKEFSQFVHPEIVDHKGTKICCVRVEQSSRPAWLTEAGTVAFFIRTGNSSRPLNPKEANDYVMSRFAGK